MGTNRVNHKIYWVAGNSSPKDYSPLDIILRQGEILVLTGQWDKAESLYLRGLADSQRMNSVRGQAECFFRLGDVQRLKGNHRESLENLKNAAELFQCNNDPASRAMVIGSMGGVYGEQGDYQKAMECLLERKSWAESTNNKMELETSWGNLGVMYAEQKMMDQALECYKKQKALAEELGDLLAVSFATGNTGNVHLFRGDYDKAIDCFQKQSEMAAQIGDKRSQCVVNCNLGLLHKRLGRLEQSLECLEKCVKSSAEIGFTRAHSIATGNMGTVYQYLGDWEQARAYFEKYKAFTEEMNDQPGLATAANTSDLEETLGNTGKALEHLQSAVGIARKNNLHDLLNILLNNLGKLLLERGSYKEASEAIAEARSTAQTQNNAEQLAMAGMLSLILRMEQGDAGAMQELEELAESETSESLKLEAWAGLFKYCGKNEYLPQS